MKPKGGKRAGAGRKKGYKFPATISKEEAREACRELIMQHFQPMIEAQVSNSLGLKYLVTRDKKTGKFVKVTEAMARSAQGDAAESIEVWEKDPNITAFTDLMNRALDKPKEQKIEVEVSNQDTQVQALLKGRQRAAERTKGTGK